MRSSDAATIAALTAERDEYERKGKELCQWIGPLLISLNVSTPEAAADAIATVTEQLRSARERINTLEAQVLEQSFALAVTANDAETIRRQADEIARLEEQYESVLQGAAKVARDLPLHGDSQHSTGAEWAACWIVGDDVFAALSEGATADQYGRGDFLDSQQDAITAILTRALSDTPNPEGA